MTVPAASEPPAGISWGYFFSSVIEWWYGFADSEPDLDPGRDPDRDPVKVLWSCTEAGPGDVLLRIDVDTPPNDDA